MIVRISGEGQFQLPDEDAERLNELDNEAVGAAEEGDEGRFQELWSQMLELVASDGNELDGDDLVESDVILPPRDISFEEAQGEFTGDGLIPDWVCRALFACRRAGARIGWGRGCRSTAQASNIIRLGIVAAAHRPDLGTHTVHKSGRQRGPGR